MHSHDEKKQQQQQFEMMIHAHTLIQIMIKSNTMRQ